MPLPKRKEVNIWPIISLLWAQKVLTITSVPGRDGQLRHAIFNEKTPLAHHRRWGVLCPKEGPLQDTVDDLDAVLVPLLAFDRKGNRLGYGKGCYDRFLARTKSVKVGVSLLPPVERVPVQAHDVPLDYVVTPSEVHVCGGI